MGEDRKRHIETAAELLNVAEHAMRDALTEISRAGGPFCSTAYREVQGSVEGVIGIRSRLPRLESDIDGEGE